MDRVKILPSIPPNAIPASCVLRIEEATLDELRRDEAIVYIRHPPTIQLLQKYIKQMQVAANATIGYGETFYVVSLSTRQPTPGQDVEIRENELLVRRVTVLPLSI